MTNENTGEFPDQIRPSRNVSMDNPPNASGGGRRGGRTAPARATPEPATTNVPPDGLKALDSIAASSAAGVEELRRVRENGLSVDLKRTDRNADPTLQLWELIKRTTESLSFNAYKAFMDLVLCNDFQGIRALGTVRFAHQYRGQVNDLAQRRFLPYTDSEAYRLLKVATEAFVTVSSGIPLQDFIGRSGDEYPSLLDRFGATDPDFGDGRVDDWWNRYLVEVNGDSELALPYLVLVKSKLGDLPVKRNIFALEEPTQTDLDRCYGILADKLLHPIMIELIWSYWHEEGMLVQTMGALGRRFQNVRGPADRDPLAMVEMDPLRPLNNVLWGYIQDEQHRLSVIRRAYEYSHHYGLTLKGKAIQSMRPADPRSRFLEAFHFLLHQCVQFYRQDDDTTVVADGFPVLNALRELHLILSEGAHNQFGDLPTNARIEMLMEQWLLARPELREFLPRRVMVAYPEPWMDSVDSMKRLQDWGDTSILDFNYLATDGERILLSARYTGWTAINDAQLAGVWARVFRDEIQRYIHSYRSVTGVDLTAPITTAQGRELIAMLPSELIQRRLQSGKNGTALPAPQLQRPAQGFRERRTARNQVRTN